MSSAKAPVIAVFIGRNGDHWRIYFARGSWCPPMLRDRLDEHGEAFPLPAPDLDDLHRHMWETDSPYEKRVTVNGGVELRAKGRSAVSLAVWLDAYLSRPLPS